MPRGLITPVTLSRKLAAGPIVVVAGDPVEGHSFDNTTQDYHLYARNDDAGVQTIETPKRRTRDGDADVQDLLSLTAGETYVFDYFENLYYGWDDPDNNLNAQNAVIINVSSANIKLWLVPKGDKTTIIA